MKVENVVGMGCLGFVLAVAGAGWTGRIAADHSGRYQHDHKLITEVVQRDDAMKAYCHGWAALEMKADGSSEVIGHCPGGSR